MNAHHRILHIDVAKGIGIILVVFAHMFTEGVANNIIFSFHMPLFFFLSGAVEHSWRKQFRVYAVNAMKTTLIPFFVFCGIGGIISFLIPEWRAVFSRGQFLADFRDAAPRLCKMAQLWFLIGLLFTKLFFFGWKKVSEGLGREYLLFLLLLNVLLPQFITDLYALGGGKIAVAYRQCGNGACILCGRSSVLRGG